MKFTPFNGIIASCAVIVFTSAILLVLAPQPSKPQPTSPPTTTPNPPAGGETASWPTYQYEEWGFAMKIHPDFIKQNERTLEKNELKIISVLFYDANGNKLTLILDFSPNVEATRAALFRAIKETEAPREQALRSFRSFWGIVDPATQILSLEKIKKGMCAGIQFTEKTNGVYNRDVELTSTTLEKMYLSISFRYQNEYDPRILPMIESIECTK